MNGSLCLRAGVLYVGRHGRSGHVAAYDLDGQPLTRGFTFRAADSTTNDARVAGLDVDRDHTLWVADSGSDCLRGFSVFGREVARFERLRGAPPNDTREGEDRRGDLALLRDVAVIDGDEDDELLITCGGRRRHGLVIARRDGAWLAGLRSEGHPLGGFQGLARAAVHGRWIWALEAGAGRIQVFRDRDFHFLFRLPGRDGGRFEPTAAAPLADGTWLVAVRGEASALIVVDAAGRLVRELARQGDEPGSVRDPEDLAVEACDAWDRTRVAVLDRDGDRVQIFTLGGSCYGALESLPG